MPEPKFVPKPGQVDFSDIRYAPVLDVIVIHRDKVLLAKRSADRKLYPNYWATIGGFLDDNESIEEKAYEELREELGMSRSSVASLERGQVVIREDESLGKTWLIVPILARVTTDRFTLDWEASEARWVTLGEIEELDVLPGTLDLITQFFSGAVL